jgi:hypothetical protein
MQRLIFLLLLFGSITASAQESQASSLPATQPASVPTSQAILSASTPQITTSPTTEVSGKFEGYAHVNVQGVGFIVYFNGGIEGGLGLKFWTWNTPSEDSVNSVSLGLEANAHSQASGVAFGGDQISKSGGDLSLRLIIEEEAKTKGSILTGGGISFRAGGGEEMFLRTIPDDVVESTPELVSYAVFSTDFYVSLLSRLQVGAGLSLYAGNGLFPTCDLLELGFTF